MKTKLVVSVEFELGYTDEKSSSYPNTFTKRKSTMAVEVDVPEELIFAFKSLTWGTNLLRVSVDGTRRLSKPEELAVPPKEA